MLLEICCLYCTTNISLVYLYFDLVTISFWFIPIYITTNVKNMHLHVPTVDMIAFDSEQGNLNTSL